MQVLTRPHGGALVNLMTSPERAQELLHASTQWPSWDLSPRQLCDLELLLNGGFSPLGGFIGLRDYEAVCSRMRLADGTLWPIPVTLDVTEEFVASLSEGQYIALRDQEGVILAALRVREAFRPDRFVEAEQVYGTTDAHHPGVRHLLQDANPICLSGVLEGVQPPVHYDFADLRHTPAEMRTLLEERRWKRVLALQTRNPLHRAHQELALRAMEEFAAGLLIHPVVGVTKPVDVDHYARVRCYQAVLKHFPEASAELSLHPLAMRMAGPREAVWHAIIRKNYGCTHLMVGRDHAGPGADMNGDPYYGPYEAQDLLRDHEDEVGVTMVPFGKMVYVEELDRYLPEDEVPLGLTVRSISRTEMRARLSAGDELPAWFTFPEIAAELRRSRPERQRQGVVVFFTGLSGSGKSTIANVLQVKLLGQGGRSVTLLDGDGVRKHLSSELGFSREHRRLNILRIGYVATEIAKHGGIAVCAPIAPYDDIRKAVREKVEQHGGMVLVHVATPLEVCEARDRKGLYANARAGLGLFTGISDPYEEPDDAEMTIDTMTISPVEAADQILLYLRDRGYLGEPGATSAALAWSCGA